MCYICTRNQAPNIGLWCNGNTTDFGSVILGSSPSRPTKSLSDSERLFLLLYLSCVIYIKLKSHPLEVAFWYIIFGVIF